MDNSIRKKILVLGATGMLGSAILRFFQGQSSFEVIGSARTDSAAGLLPDKLKDCVVTGVDAENIDSLLSYVASTNPDIIINCIGVVKQRLEVNDPLVTVPLNSLLPHRLAKLAKIANARLVHISTDCVFSGTKGGYTEQDTPDASDLYGLSKYIGEVDYPHAVTLRTSIIGHELAGSSSLVNWFLSQNNSVRGFRRAIFSGLPTVEVARVIRDHVIPNPHLRGVYHVSSEPINKFELLKLIAKAYEKKVEIKADDDVVIDRSLDSSRFSNETGFVAPAWPDLIKIMHEFG